MKTMKPIKGTETPVVEEKADSKPSTPESGVEKGRFFTTNMLDRPVTRHDGGFAEYIMNPGGPAHEDHLYQEMTKVIGLTSDEETGLRNELVELTKLIAEHTQNDRHDIVGQFVRKLLRTINFGTSNTSKIHALRRKLLELRERKE